jgi:hypothetical protein
VTECVHTQPFSGVVTFNVTAPPQCIFCERDRLLDEIARLKEALAEALEKWEQNSSTARRHLRTTDDGVRIYNLRRLLE